MAIQRLKVDPEAIDLMITAIVLQRRDCVQHAGHYAFLALGRVMSKSLPEEEGPTTPTNFSWRLDQLVKEKGMPREWSKQVYVLWNKIRFYLYQKVSSVPPIRARNIKAFVQSVRFILEQTAGIKFEDILSTMTFVDKERLHRQYGDSLVPEENFG
jgi:hypothetical protein